MTQFHIAQWFTGYDAWSAEVQKEEEHPVQRLKEGLFEQKEMCAKSEAALVSRQQPGDE